MDDIDDLQMKLEQKYRDWWAKQIPDLFVIKEYVITDKQERIIREFRDLNARWHDLDSEVSSLEYDIEEAGE